jgi:geranylgeranyl diphosphate synthase type I
MARPGRVLGNAPARWPRIVVDTAKALGGNHESAIAVAAATEMVVAAIDVVDNVIDDEWSEALEDLATGRALNASLALVLLAQRVLCGLDGYVGGERACLIGSLLASAAARCCCGQDQDMRLEALADVTEDQALAMTRLKSGSLLGLACQVGAATAPVSDEILDAVFEIGANAGVVAQILNDLVGVDPRVPERGTDLRLRKKTLPIAYAVRHARELDCAPVVNWADSAHISSSFDEGEVVSAMEQLGALHFAWVVADAHRREALSGVNRLVELTGRPEVASLRKLVPRLPAARDGRA